MFLHDQSFGYDIALTSGMATEMIVQFLRIELSFRFVGIYAYERSSKRAH